MAHHKQRRHLHGAGTVIDNERISTAARPTVRTDNDPVAHRNDGVRHALHPQFLSAVT
jgi:hypothetical protein